MTDSIKEDQHLREKMEADRPSSTSSEKTATVTTTAQRQKTKSDWRGSRSHDRSREDQPTTRYRGDRPHREREGGSRGQYYRKKNPGYKGHTPKDLLEPNAKGSVLPTSNREERVLTSESLKNANFSEKPPDLSDQQAVVVKKSSKQRERRLYDRERKFKDTRRDGKLESKAPVVGDSDQSHGSYKGKDKPDFERGAKQSRSTSKTTEPDAVSSMPSSSNKTVISDKQVTSKHKTDSNPDAATRPQTDQDQGKPSKEYKRKATGSAHHGRGRSSKPRAMPTVQSDELAQHLTAESYECMVCCDRVKGRDQVWSCQNCYHVFHLRCVKKWATAPVAMNTDEVSSSEGWRCPSCRNLSTVIPTVYKCYCGKVTNPRLKSKGELTVPHSCGGLCLKKLAVTPESKCRHKCRLPCHPGPCPPCPVMVTRNCPCGRKSHQVRCSKVGDLPSCGAVCGKDMNCGRHVCESECHPAPCVSCTVLLTLECHCKREKRDVVCGETQEMEFSCSRTCGKELDCGNHLCELQCHKGVCPSCELLPSNVITCPCGATPISELLLSEGIERVSCLDPVPLCKNICGKILPCSTEASPHICSSQCHIGECPPCNKSTIIHCRCGRTSLECLCVEVKDYEDFCCQHLCNKKKSCGRHRCNVRCCVDSAHQCSLLCGKKLQCGLHTCQENCHSRHCQRCWEYSFEELSCHCGSEVIYPPIPCGTRPPPCSRVCARMHPCSHPVTHPCHSEEECPPCTYLTEKQCMGGHETRRNIPCHITDVSCGNQCGKPLACGMHKCIKTCHKNDCLSNSLEGCRQPCTTKRMYCEHECGAHCHVGRPCPDTPCKATIAIKCNCGRRSEKVLCLACGSEDMKQSFQRMFSKDLGARIRDLQSGATISISSLSSSSTPLSHHHLRSLECDEVCAQEDRNKKLAAALEIENPNISPSLESDEQYSPFLIEQARADLESVKSFERSLQVLVESALKSTSTQSRSHMFDPMNSTHRRVIHELAMHYGCETMSYDQEPKRSVMVLTKKSTAKVPHISLTKLIERERYKPPPAPVSVMAVSNKQDDLSSFKSSPPDYFADDFCY